MVLEVNISCLNIVSHMSEHQVSQDSPSGLGGRTRRAPKRPDSVARRAMIVAGQELVAEQEGLTVSLDHLSYEDIIQRAGVSRSTAYRLWPYKERYYVDLVCELAGPDWQSHSALDEATQQLALEIVTRDLDRLRTREGRLAVLDEAVRIATLQNYRAVVDSPHWRTYVTISATLMSTPAGPDKDRVLDALRAAENYFIDSMARFYQIMVALLGLKIRGPFEDLRLLAAASAAIVEGLALRQISIGDIVDRPLEIDGETWSLAAVGFRGILWQMAELDDDYDPDAAIAEFQGLLDSR
jgi:AcrR family transcriptional regulator